MGFFFKLFVGFWAIWILWYLTGGPLRDDKSKPFIGPTGNGELIKYSTTTIPR